MSDSSRSDFAARIIAALLDAGEPEPEYDADSFCLHSPDGSTRFLSGFFKQWGDSSDPEERARLIRVLVNKPDAAFLPEIYSAAKDNLRPRLRASTWHGIRDLRRAPPSSPLERRVIAEGLVVDLVFDTPTHSFEIGASSLHTWGVSFEEALQDALDALARRSVEWTRYGKGVWAARVGDSYDAARLLLLEDRLRLPTDGRPIALLPSKDLLLLTGEADSKGLDFMTRVGEQALKSGAKGSFAVLCHADGEWRRWRPPADHPLATRLGMMEREARRRAYAAQAAVMIELGQSDVRIAALEVRLTLDGPQTRARFPESGTALLPAADVWLAKDGDRAIEMSMAEVLKHAGDRAQLVVELDPPRFLCRGPLSVADIEAIRAASIR